MMRNTLRVWLYAFLFLMIIAMVCLLSMSVWGLIVLAHVTFFIILVVFIVCGVLSGLNKGSFRLSMVIAVIWTLIFFFLFNKTLDYIVTQFIVSLPLLCTLLSFGFTKAFRFFASGKYMPIKAVIIMICLAVFTTVFYFAAAHSSIFPYSFFEIDNFYFYPQDENTRSMYDKDGRLYMADLDGKPFTGIKYSYGPQMKISTFPRKIFGVHYYFDGVYYGGSVKKDITRIMRASIDNPSRRVSHAPDVKLPSGEFINHKDYENAIKTWIAGLGEYYYTTYDSERDDGYKYMQIFTEKDGKPEKRLVTFYPNGVIARVEVAYFIDSNFGYYNYENEVSFDTLGFAKDGNWSEKDFVVSDFNAENFLENNSSTNEKFIKRFTAPEIFNSLSYSEK